jgi:hypothetical protein
MITSLGLLAGRERGRQLLALAVLVVALPLAVSAQTPGGINAQRATRAQLDEELIRLNVQLPRAKATEKTGLQAQMSAIRERLESGDFKPGDRFVISMRQDSVRTDTLIVRDSLRVAVFNLPDFSVAGVLRSELEDKLGAHVGRFLRNAAVRTTLLTRISVTGAVTKPGFYYAGPDRPINDLLTSAGGPLADADVAKLSVSRMGRKILSERVAKRAMEEGSTLEALDVQSGDTVHIPLKRKVNWQLVVQLAFVIMSLFFALLQFMQWYYNRQDA